MSEVKLKQGYLEVDNLDSLKKLAEKDITLQGLFKLMEVLWVHQKVRLSLFGINDVYILKK